MESAAGQGLLPCLQNIGDAFEVQVSYHCTACDRPCTLDTRDDSVGYTEMGSHGMMDPSRPYAVSACCEASFVETEARW